MIPIRAEIWLVVFLFVCVSMFVGTAINIAILTMVKTNDDYTNSSSPLAAACRNSTFQYMSLEKDEISISHFIPENNILEWTEMEQNSVLTSVYWFSGFVPFIGGLLCHRYGVKKVVSTCTVISGLASSLTPYIAYKGALYVTCLRAVQGVIMGIATPVSVFSVMGKWSPPDERGRFMSIFLAVPLGEAACYMVSGFIAERYGWMYVFHTVSAITVLWLVLWLFFMYNSPEEHPRISSKEKNYILSTLGQDVAPVKLQVPWIDILLSVSFWITILCNFGCSWISIMASVYGPMYFKHVFGFATEKNGMVSGIPYIAKAAVTYLMGSVTDVLLKKKYMSVANVRKLCAFLGNVLCGCAVCGVLYADCDVNIAVTSISLTVVLSAFYTVGPSVSIVDMSPNFCDIMLGISCTMAYLSGYFCTVLANYFSLHYGIGLCMKGKVRE